MKRLILIILIGLPNLLWAGDVAEFVNIGFSADGRTFMFGEQGFNKAQSETYANVFVVDVASNEFVNGGLFKTSNKAWLEPGDNANGGTFQLIETASPLRKRYNIDYFLKGRLLYVAATLNDQAGAVPNSPLNFQDFQNGISYTVSIDQQATGSGANTISAFSIYVTLNKGGSPINLRVGHPNFKRKRVLSYRIERVILAPTGKQLVFVIAKEEFSSSGSPNVRYMVETVALN